MSPSRRHPGRSCPSNSSDVTTGPAFLPRGFSAAALPVLPFKKNKKHIINSIIRIVNSTVKQMVGDEVLPLTVPAGAGQEKSSNVDSLLGRALLLRIELVIHDAAVVEKTIDGDPSLSGGRLQHSSQKRLREEKSRQPENQRLTLFVPALKTPKTENDPTIPAALGTLTWLTLKNASRCSKSEK